MKTKCFGCTHPLVRFLLGLFASMTCSFLTCKSIAQITLIDFENIPPTYTPVDSFGALLPGVTLSSGGKWIADEVCNSCFANIQGRAITAFPDGSASLSISFAALAQDVRMDFGSSHLGSTLTVGVSGYRNNQLVFSDSFVTHPVTGGADEVRAQTFGMVDRVVVARTAGDANLILDNLSFVTVVVDSDGDGVPDDQDECPDTAPGAVVNEHGCSIDQLVPCAGPVTGGTWRNHGHYVSAVKAAADAFLAARLVTADERDEAVRSAARSTCGKK